MSGKVKAMKEAAKAVAQGAKSKAGTASEGIKEAVKGKASQAGSAIASGLAASEEKGKNIVAQKTVDGLKKKLARSTSRAQTADTFKAGIKSGIGAATASKSNTVTGETIKRAAGRLTDSEYINTAIKPGLSSAFEQAGGRSGAAKRIIGGAAIGGTATGTIGALRGNDFWESSRSGVVAGAGLGAGRQVQQMGRTEVGSATLGSMRDEMTTARREASTSQGLKESMEFHSNFKETYPKPSSIVKGAKHRANQYQSNTFMENLMSDMTEAKDSRLDVFRDATAKAEARGQEVVNNAKAKVKKKSSPDIPKRQDYAPDSNVSNPVRVLQRHSEHSQMANSLFGNHQGGRKNTGMRKRMR